MFHPDIVEKKLILLSKDEGFELQRHSIQDCETAGEYLEDLLQDNKLTRDLTPEEIKWIRNERAICAADFRYWVERYAFINSRENRLIRFRFQVGQDYMVKIWGEMELEGIEIVLLVLKARQLGISTLSELVMAWFSLWFPHVREIVGSSDPDKSALMSKMMELAWLHLPWWMKPVQTKYKSGQLIEFGEIPTSVSIQHGTQFTGIGRGTTVTKVHLSECAEFNKPEEIVEAALLNAVHPSPRVFMIFESTAKGTGNWWHKKWIQSVKGYKDGWSRFRGVFLPWYVGVDLYPNESFMFQHREKFSFYEPSDIAVKHAQRAEAYVKSNETLRKFMPLDWKMPKEQMFWWEMKRREHQEQGILSKFMEEMPADDIEAFQATGGSVFDPQLLTELSNEAKEPIAIYSLVGDDGEISPKLRPIRSEIDITKKPIHVLASWSATQPTSRYSFIPLKWNGISGFDPTGKLVVWELPKNNEQYGIGVDTSEGIGQDSSVIQVVRKGTISTNDAQVAEFSSPYLSAFELWPFVNAIGTLYSVKGKDSLQKKQAKVVIEHAGNGESVYMELRKRGWWNFHHRVKYDNKRGGQALATQWGWQTNLKTRAMMLDHLITYVREKWLDIESPWLIHEMGTFHKHPDKLKLMARDGEHDDRLMSLGIVLFSLHDMEAKGVEPIAARQRTADQAFYPTYQGHPASKEIRRDSPMYNYIGNFYND